MKRHDNVLPKEALALLNVQRGDEIFLTESDDGSYKIGQYDPEFDEQMAAMEVVGRECRNTLKKLAE